ncbi:sodium:calcium symporter [Ruficoccus amylovorans]|uniref:Sodium:calcium symporter n=2 Tax=Ruficoccus amylovorans TaxID=1804625 RepID=A0A842HLN0_9BACT|nr:sodium:calcium symporter [Ruficoccus amylovorans]
MSCSGSQEGWNSRLGVILAVAGSAVGLGNFLRFPGQAAEHGGGAFMIAYVISFLIIGLPMCWSEWTLGRHGGSKGFNSCPGIFNAIWRSPAAKYVGIIGVLIPVIIYMYYVNIEAWCLGYAVNFLAGNLDFDSAKESTGWWASFIGAGENGAALVGGAKEGMGPLQGVGVYLLAVFALNFLLIYRGVSGGIELFCKVAVPTLVVLALVVLIRVMTLGAPDPAEPAENVNNGLGFLWNPNKTFFEETDPATGEVVYKREVVDKHLIAEFRQQAAQDPERYTVREVSIWTQLANPQLWLAAAGQIFFSLSVGFGVIITYSSYMRKDDDIVLSGLAATSANEFCEVALGGLITVPAAVAFIGVAGLSGIGLSTFDLGFKVLPLVFSEMPLGNVFGFLWFFLLFLAAMTSSISMLQPGIAFIEEAFKTDRKRSTAILGFVTAVGSAFVVYFSADAKALDTLDFWAANFLIFVLATIQIIMFGWIFGVDRGLSEASRGAAIRIPRIYRFVIKFLCPLFLITVFVLWVLTSVFGLNLTSGESELSSYIVDLFVEPNVAAWLSVGLMATLGVAFLLIVSTVQRYKDYQKQEADS